MEYNPECKDTFFEKAIVSSEEVVRSGRLIKPPERLDLSRKGDV